MYGKYKSRSMKINILVSIVFILLFTDIILSNTTGLKNSLIFCGIIWLAYKFGRYIQTRKDKQ